MRTIKKMAAAPHGVFEAGVRLVLVDLVGRLGLQPDPAGPVN